jgi:hypothetical protein
MIVLILGLRLVRAIGVANRFQLLLNWASFSAKLRQS